MKKMIAILGGVGTVAAGLALAPSASARNLNIGDGEAVVVLDKCNNDGKPQSTPDRVPDCSYTSFMGKGGNATKATFTYLSSDGAVTWNVGTLTSGALNFPAGQQTWPPITGLPLGTVSKSTPSDISGTINTSTGLLELKLKVATTLTAGDGKTCDITGDVTLRSDSTDPFGGVAGANYDPATGKFAVAAATPAVIATTGSGCSSLKLLYDVDKGMGYYITGKIGLPGGKEPEVPVPGGGGSGGGGGGEVVTKKVQDAVVKTPKSIKAKGKTVILKKAITTNAGQKATAKVTWSKKKSAKGTSKKLASVTQTKSGKVTITTIGKAKKIFVKLVTKAPATDTFQAFTYTKSWTVK